MEYDANGHAIPPYDGWAPYCLMCSTMMRMEPTTFGWRCRSCGNPIGRDLCHYPPQHTAHIGDYLSAKLHNGVSLTQAMNDPVKAAELVYGMRKTPQLVNPILS